MKFIIDTMFDNYDSFDLVINKGIGSPYENFMDIAADHSSKIVMDMLQDIHDKGAKTEEK